MTKAEMDKLRSNVLYKDESLFVKYTGKWGNFTKNKIYEAKPRFATHSGLPYPQPKWIASTYEILDDDGDVFPISDVRYGKLPHGFEWIRD